MWQSTKQPTDRQTVRQPATDNQLTTDTTIVLLPMLVRNRAVIELSQRQMVEPASNILYLIHHHHRRCRIGRSVQILLNVGTSLLTISHF